MKEMNVITVYLNIFLECNENGVRLNDTIYGIDGNITSLVENMAKENENNITIQTP